VQAAFENQRLGLIDHWLRHIKDVFNANSKEIDKFESKEEKINRLCEINVRAQVMNVCHSPFVQQAWKEGQEVSVNGWIYDLKNGLLNDLDLCISSAEETSSIYEV
jgi:carbonic anhydrase